MTVEKALALEAKMSKYASSIEAAEAQRRAIEINQAVASLGIHLAEQIKAAHKIIEPVIPHIQQALILYNEFAKTLAIPVIQMSIAVRELVTIIDPVIIQHLQIWNQVKHMTLRQVLEVLDDARSYEPDSEWNGEKEIAKLTQDEQKELVAATEIVIAQHPNWQFAFEEWRRKWIEKNPALVWIWSKYLRPILIGVIITFVGGVAIYHATVARQTSLREEPFCNAPIIVNMIENQNIFIIESVPYWCKVEYEDMSSGEVYCGWLSKRSIKQSEHSAQYEGDKIDE